MPAINLSPTWTQTTPNIWQTQCSSPHLWFETGEIKTCQARSPTGPAAPHHHLCQLLLSQELFENNELIVHCVISLLHFGLFVVELFLGARARMWVYWSPTWLGCNGVERKMAAYLMTGVKRLWRRQKSRTPWGKTRWKLLLHQWQVRKSRFILN